METVPISVSYLTVVAYIRPDGTYSLQPPNGLLDPRGVEKSDKRKRLILKPSPLPIYRIKA